MIPGVLAEEFGGAIVTHVVPGELVGHGEYRGLEGRNGKREKTLEDSAKGALQGESAKHQA